MKIKASDYIAKFLKAQEVKFVFEMSGGMITQILDSIHQEGGIDIVSMHHEQSAAFAVDAYGRCTGNVAVGMATSGPGATNLITGIASCYFDSSPGLFITGQVNIHEQKGDRGIRQLGFQETDIVSMAQIITKKSYAITSAEQIESTLKEAYEIAISDRPGPVLIDIPMNLQRAEIEIDKIEKIERKKIKTSVDNGIFDVLIEAIMQAKKPLILAGGGIHGAGATEAFLRLVDQLQIPVVTSLLAVDTIAFDHPLRVGFIGSYGNRWANIALGHCDLLIVMGSRLDIRQTGADVESFRQNKKIFHVDCDVSEINNRVKGCVPIVMDAADFIDEMLQILDNKTLALKKSWYDEILQQKIEWPDINELRDITGINPNQFMHRLSQSSQNAKGYVVDVGNHQMWSAQSLEMNANQFFITSGGMGAMGFALPAAIGASLAHDKKPVIVIAGDGCFQLNIQELQTIVRNNIPLKMIVINNNCLGMIRQFQDSYFNGRYLSTYWGYSAPNFAAVAMAYGIPAKTISISEEIESNLEWLWKSEGAALLQVMVDMRANAYPKIAFGHPITEMEPMIAPVAMEAT
ncbi:MULTISPECIES: thiamine pyrophosphate-binding protein [Legionella]|uniref:Acetolactate synthase n=1 Tax=Legionella maceachernii TaxID=466 RepID=A0A0W0VV87_9GAMM|nr:thiamine pyrophosphate-binding protein [Legionella maceachernii]KTD24151.1 acetolactate synthase [Legionella maceachernii]SJZ87459.1 acetolactate synthase-1/2/3 large subunit [Legionella maceachernii]SUO98935.1 Acetolactate synthase large subunit [Legionella maceachernii]